MNLCKSTMKLFIFFYLVTIVHGFKLQPRLLKNRVISQQENITFEQYLNYKEVQSYLDTVVQTYPKMASLEVIGHSLEGRAMRVLRISKDDNRKKPAVFMDAGIHAREWLGPPTVLHVVYQLTALAAENQDYLDLADWYILPVANPDGYIYTWTRNRTWRKNRRNNTREDCPGVDLNRNFDIHWGQELQSRDPCSNRFAGAYPNSEPETVAMSRFLVSLKGRLSLYLGIHSAAQRLLYPYGYSTNRRAPEDVISAAEQAAAAAHKVRGTVYPNGNIAADLYPAYGVSVDYAAEKADARFSYGWELPEGGATRYDPPPSEILPVAKEIWEGVKTLAKIAIPKSPKEVNSVLIQSSTEGATSTVPTVQSEADTVQSEADTVQSKPSASSVSMAISNWLTLTVVTSFVHFLLFTT